MDFKLGVCYDLAVRIGRLPVVIRTPKARLETSGALLSALFLPMASQSIHPYIDPGTGSLVLQVAIAILVGGLFLLKIFWRKVKTFLKRLFSRTGKGNG